MSSFLLLCFSVLLCLPPSFSSLVSTLPKGSSLSVEKPQKVLTSSRGIFSSGFYPVGDNAYSFAIWFNKPLYNGNRTIVWMANRDQPVNGKLSELSLQKDGNLILTDAGRSIIWATNTVSSSWVQLDLHDNGNLILQTSEGVILWQSFDSPTDTLLPLQRLTRFTELISSRSQSNHSSGFYKLFFDDDNILRLLFNGPETSSIYWPETWLSAANAGRSRYNDTRIAFFDDSGHFLSSDLLEFRAADFGEGPFRRLTLDSDGNLRLYSFQDTNWALSWQAKSKSCRIHGACGINGICTYVTSHGRICTCLSGFKIKDPYDWSYGCEPEFDLTCNRDEVFIKKSNADFYGYDIQIFRNLTLEQCRNKCLDLCNCKGFHHRFNESTGAYDCNPKWLLRNGHQSPSLPGDLYVKVPRKYYSKDLDGTLKAINLSCSDKAQLTKQIERKYRKKIPNGIVKFLLWFASGTGFVEIIIIFSVWFFFCRSNGSSRNVVQDYLLGATGFKRFTYAELKKATSGFKAEIGRGGGGVVYKGVLSDGRVAAIKLLNEACQGEAEFLAEIDTIGRINHMNLIVIWGYCFERKHRLLVYEYMEHGSLADNLYLNTLDGDKRFEIAVGTAKGLAYLHEECLEWVLHCDVKPQNILLGCNYQPKVADFGLSKLLSRGSGNSSHFSKIRGTRGYMAPEWIFNLPITSKVDVYSYGVVLLEMVTGKSPTANLESSGHLRGMEQQKLIKWVEEEVSGGIATMLRLEEILDPTLLKCKCDINKMKTLVEVALKCVEEDKDARPTMKHVLQMLQC